MERGHLPRLAAEYYRGRASVHWALTVEGRATGWLSPSFHQAWQLLLLHACARYELACPVYVLMPDHMHVLWLGLNEQSSDQRLAIEFLRKHLRRHLAPSDWQRQSYDHVLKESERQGDAFQGVAHYIAENPIRAGIVARWQTYDYVGCAVPGYPEFDIRAEDYWERFWRCHNYLVTKRGT